MSECLRSFQRFPNFRCPPHRPGCAGPPPLEGRLRVLRQYEGDSPSYHFAQSKRPWGADTRHDRPKCRIYSNAAGASPGQHTIPNAILLSNGTIVKHNCAKWGAGLRKTLLFYPKGFQKLDIRGPGIADGIGKNRRVGAAGDSPGRAYFFDTGAKLWYYGIQNALPTNFGPNFKAGKDRHYA